MRLALRRERTGSGNPIGRLLAPIDTRGPKVRLALLWALLSFVATAIGPVVLSLLLAPVVLAAAGQTSRTWRKRADGRRPLLPVSILAPPLAVLAAGAFGPLAAVAVIFGALMSGYVTDAARRGSGRASFRITAAITLGIGAGASGLVVVRDVLGPTAALVLVLLVHAVDASIFVVGAEARSRLDGLIAGLASAAAVGLAVAAVLVPPFRGSSPWILSVLVAVLVPLGGMAGTAMLGRAEAPVPGLRRLDGFLLTAPVWGVVARMTLDLG